MTQTDAKLSNIAREDVARGAGVVALSRLGALVELVTTPAYIWLFGVPSFGLYLVLWSAVNLASNCLDLALTGALQRVVPQSDETRAHSALKLALLVGIIPSLLVALGATLAAEEVGTLVSAAPADLTDLALAIGLFAWALPLWTFIEISTAALRARRAFGPEVRLRIFWEQIVRLLLAAALFALGLRAIGLIVAHLLSLAVIAVLSVRLLARHYDLSLLKRAPLDSAVLRELLGCGLALFPGSIITRAFSDLPPILLNVLLPGATGATAAGLYGIARKISSVPQLIRQTFNYVMAPLASAQAGRDRTAIQPLYAFATRISTALVIPLCTTLILLAGPILSLFSPAAVAAEPMLIVLVLARAVEAACGPAGPILSMIGKRRWIVLNAFSGLVVWAALAVLLVPDMRGLGMAIAVGCGTATASVLALVQLRVTQGLHAASRRLGIGFAVGAVNAALLWAVDRAVEPLGHALETAVLLALFLPVLWLGLRFGLSRADRDALGPKAQRLLLARA